MSPPALIPVTTGALVSGAGELSPDSAVLAAARRACADGLMVLAVTVPSRCRAGGAVAVTVIPTLGVIGPRRGRADQEKAANRKGRGPCGLA